MAIITATKQEANKVRKSPKPPRTARGTEKRGMHAPTGTGAPARRRRVTKRSRGWRSLSPHAHRTLSSSLVSRRRHRAGARILGRSRAVAETDARRHAQTAPARKLRRSVEATSTAVCVQVVRWEDAHRGPRRRFVYSSIARRLQVWSGIRWRYRIGIRR
jgi:hypothetical protein